MSTVYFRENISITFDVDYTVLLSHIIIIFLSPCARRKKVVCVLKSYAMRPELSVPGSPVPSERALLTEHAMRLPHSSPTMQRGEILIEWKDGTVTPLYEAWGVRGLITFGGEENNRAVQKRKVKNRRAKLTFAMLACERHTILRPLMWGLTVKRTRTAAEKTSNRKNKVWSLLHLSLFVDAIKQKLQLLSKHLEWPLLLRPTTVPWVFSSQRLRLTLS